MVGANFVPADFVALVTWIVLFFYEPFPVKRWDTHADVNALIGSTGRWWFGFVWRLIKAMNVVALFTYIYYSAVYTLMEFQVVPSLIIGSELLAKFWPRLFFVLNMRLTALGLSFVLLATAVTTCVLMGVYNANLGRLYPVPLALYSIYALGLLFAFILNLYFTGLLGRVSFRIRMPDSVVLVDDVELAERKHHHKKLPSTPKKHHTHA